LSPPPCSGDLFLAIVAELKYDRCATTGKSPGRGRDRMGDEWTVRGLVGGRHGGLVRLEGRLVPPRVLITYAGVDPGYEVAAEVRGGRPEVVGISMVAKRDGREIRPGDLHDLERDLRTLVEDAFARLAVRPEQSPDEPDAVLLWGPGSEDEVRANRRTVRASRGKPPRTELERVSALYRTGASIAAIRETMGYSSERTTTRRVRQAADAGLLPQTTMGKRRRA
jgi:hypothetical protein